MYFQWFDMHKSLISALIGGPKCNFRMCKGTKYDEFMMILLMMLMMMMHMMMMMMMMMMIKIFHWFSVIIELFQNLII